MAPHRLSLSALFIGLAFSSPALSLGFGELQVQSQLNQPLQAEIPLLGVPAYASDTVRVRLGKREDFARFGYDYVPELHDIRTELQQRDNRLVLVLSSRSALREPLLNIVLVAEEGNARYLRDFAVLLDLPGTRLAESAPTTVPETPREVSEPVLAVPAPVVAETKAVATTAKSRVATATASDPGTDATQYSTRYGPTRVGESLSSIAYRLGKASGVGWHAYGVALYHANPEAFIAGDPNKLKAAMPLQLPTAEAVQRYKRSDWQALFTEPVLAARTGAATAVPATTAPSTTATATTTPAIPTTTTTAVMVEPSLDNALLQTLQQQNQTLKAELAATTARMQALEQQLAELDSRYASLTSAPTTTNSVAPQSTANSTPSLSNTPASSTPATTATVSPPSTAETLATPASAEPKPAPVTVAIRDTLARQPVAADMRATDTLRSSSTVVNWQGAVWPLLTLLGLIGLGALFWHWRERQHLAHLLRPRSRSARNPRPVLPEAEVDEAATPPVEASSPDRRVLKLKQVQAALDTYLTYQRFDRAHELLEQEMLLAGDDLLLRRQLQRMQKEMRKAQTEWEQTHKEHMSAMFDRATTGHVDKPTSRDESKKTSG